jgi:lipoate-protein ligase A
VTDEGNTLVPLQGLRGAARLEQEQLCSLLDAGIDEPQLLAWRYSDPAIVLGRSQRATPGLLQRASEAGVEVVARAGGGGAVLAGPWMASLSLLLPVTHDWARASLPASYRKVGEACRSALLDLSVVTSLAREHRALAPHADLGWACFAEVSHGELLVSGERKILGLCQARRRDAVVVSIGVLLTRPEWRTLVRVWRGQDEPALAQRLEDCTACCDEFTPGSAGTVIDSLVAAVHAALPSARLAA